MVLGHVSDSWMREADRHALPYWTISFIAGLGAPLFLFIAGVAMALAAHSRAATRGVSEAARGLWIRGWQIFALAFLFRLQALVLGQGAPVTLLTVDILNVMGLSMVAGALIWRAGSPGKSRQLVLAAVVILIAAATPWLWTTSWLAWMPDPLRWYLQPTPGRTNFTLVPSAGFLIAGLLAGEVLARAHAAALEHRMYLALTLAGALIAGVGWWASHGPSVFAGATFWGSSPTFFAVRLGLLVLLLPAAWAYYRVWRVWRVEEGREQKAEGSIVETLGRSSLFVYWIHVEMVYGLVATPLERQLPLETMLMAAGALSLLLYGIVLVKNRWTQRGQGAQSARGARGAANGGDL